MNYLRPIFICLFALLLLVLTCLALAQLVQGTLPVFSWLGLLLAAASPGLFLALQWILPRRDAFQEPLVFSTLAGLGLAVTMAVSWKHGDAAGITHVWAGACLVLWFLYLKVFARTTGAGQQP